MPSLPNASINPRVFFAVVPSAKHCPGPQALGLLFPKEGGRAWEGWEETLEGGAAMGCLPAHRKRAWGGVARGAGISVLEGRLPFAASITPRWGEALPTRKRGWSLSLVD